MRNFIGKKQPESAQNKPVSMEIRMMTISRAIEEEPTCLRVIFGYSSAEYVIFTLLKVFLHILIHVFIHIIIRLTLNEEFKVAPKIRYVNVLGKKNITLIG